MYAMASWVGVWVDVELRAAAMDLSSSSEKAVPSCALCFRLLHKPNEGRVLPSSSTSNVWRVLRHSVHGGISFQVANVDKNFFLSRPICARFRAFARWRL